MDPLVRLARSITQWNQWRQEHPDIQPNLRDAKLGNANLSKANLSRIDFRGADLSEANLSEANLGGADLSYVNLRGADLSKANLCEAKLIHTDLSHTDLSNADLSETKLRGGDLSDANLRHANLRGASLDGTSVAGTIFGDLDLRVVRGLETLTHNGPSYISTSTLERSQGDIPQVFLRGAGLNETLIDYLPSLFTQPIQYYSLFLSYCDQDEIFARRLYHDLQNNGVRCWFAPHHLQPGSPIFRGIGEAIHLHDKLLLVLSQHTVASSWVEMDVYSALQKEKRNEQRVLFPLRLDNTVLESNAGWTRLLQPRHIADFTNWQDKETYQKAFTMLLHYLKVTQAPIISVNGKTSISLNPSLAPCGHELRPNARFCHICGYRY